MALQKKQGGGSRSQPLLHPRPANQSRTQILTYSPTARPCLTSSRWAGKNSRRIPGAEEEMRWMPSMLDGAEEEEEEEGRLGEKRVSK